jgi:hypothetical protein
MELDLQDHDVVKLLTKLKNAHVVYPAGLLTPRRQKYIERVEQIGFGLGIAPVLRTALKRKKSRGSPPTTGGLLETVLLVAIIAESVSAAYIYRDKISEVARSLSTKPQILEVTAVLNSPSPIPEVTAIKSPAPSVTPSSTETPTVTTSATVVKKNDSNNQVGATPDPNGNNGNHYGQTPKPERTKDKGGNNDGEDKDKDKDNHPTP